MISTFNNTHTKIIAVFALILAIIGVFSLSAKQHTQTALIDEKKALEERIYENRKIREEKRKEQEERNKAHEAQYAEWKQEDDTLSGAINADKARLEAVEFLLGDKPSWSIVNQAHASEVQPPAHQHELMNGNDAPTSVAPGHSTIQCAIGTGSHDVRHLAKNYPGVAGWKNNSVSGLTLGSKALEAEFDKAGIQWFVGTARPKNEGSHYYGFPDLENGLKAKLLVIRRSYTNSTIAQYLKRWGTDEIPTTLSRTRTIGSLSDAELISLIRLQIVKESGRAMADYVFDNVIICN